MRGSGSCESPLAVAAAYGGAFKVSLLVALAFGLGLEVLSTLLFFGLFSTVFFTIVAIEKLHYNYLNQSQFQNYGV